jgi:hypothetical protein
MDGHTVGFVVGVALFAGIAAVGKRYGSQAEKKLERAAWVAVGGAFVGLVLLGVIWSTFWSSAETARDRSIERTVRSARPAIDDFRLAADRYVESGCAEGATMSGEPTEAELLCPAGIVLDVRWMDVIDPMVEASTEASPACYERLAAVVAQTNTAHGQTRRTASKVAAAHRPGQTPAALHAMDRAFARLDAAYASARAACRG